MLRLKDLFKGKHLEFQEQRFNLTGISMLYILRFNLTGISMLYILLVVTVVLSVVFIIGPLFLMRDRVPLPKKWGLVGLVFFASIGFGYILVEISQLQRLIIFLGHPIYSITVVLFSMLFASGLGAMASNMWTQKMQRSFPVFISMAILLGLLVFVIYMQPGILKVFEKSTLYIRISIAISFLMPLGFFMGLPFPIGMELAVARSKEHTPWFWAINGATSVVSSVLSVCISIAWGFTATLKVGFFSYLFAATFLLVLNSMVNKQRQE
jgi:hypothetical protein